MNDHDIEVARADMAYVAALRGQITDLTLACRLFEESNTRAQARVAELEQDRDEWRDLYERLAGAFELYENIQECQQALADYAGIFYDVVLGALATERDQWRTCAVILAQPHAELETARELRPEVRAFAGLMEAKLRENDHKPGWKQDDPYALYRRLCEEVGELRATLKKPFAVAGEAADVANFAMMICDVCGWLVDPADAAVKARANDAT